MSKAKFNAKMVLPKGAMQRWSNIMNGEVPVSKELDIGAPIVMSAATFEDGTKVYGGVLKSGEPEDYNIKFMWVFDKYGNHYPDSPINTSDEENFLNLNYQFSLRNVDDEGEYELKIVEA